MSMVRTGAERLMADERGGGAGRSTDEAFSFHTVNCRSPAKI
jgi:hypothetical protein